MLGKRIRLVKRKITEFTNPVIELQPVVVRWNLYIRQVKVLGRFDKDQTYIEKIPEYETPRRSRRQW